MVNKTFHEIIELLIDKHCIDISKYEEKFLTKSIEKRLVITSSSSLEHYKNYLVENKEEALCLSTSLNNNYTTIFRNTLTFAVLEHQIIPSLILKKEATRSKEIRIWSAACASGLEAYSMAMLLEEQVNKNNRAISYRIFATDKSEQQIGEAQKGIYTEDALGNVSLKRLNHWFTKHKNTYAIKQELKEKIDFSVFDLFNEQLSCPPASIFGSFDIVICANLMFYYKSKYRSLILDKVTGSMTDGGYFVTGEAERDMLLNNQFKEVALQSAIFQRNTKRG